MASGSDAPPAADLVVRDAELVATVDARRREIPGGWVAVTDGFVSGVGGPGDPVPPARRVVSAAGCLVTPGLVNTHHHLYQNLTRAYAPMTRAPLFGWLETLYPLWTAALDEEAVYTAAWVGLVELALSG
ncbi:MAG: 8-oxoguanine deaminase, partial [Actinomyces sp.]